MILVFDLALTVARFNLDGVALAVDVMMACGSVILPLQSQACVGLSTRCLFAAPALALGLGLLRLGGSALPAVVTDWHRRMLKAPSFFLIKALVVLAPRARDCGRGGISRCSLHTQTHPSSDLGRFSRDTVSREATKRR